MEQDALSLRLCKQHTQPHHAAYEVQPCITLTFYLLFTRIYYLSNFWKYILEINSSINSTSKFNKILRCLSERIQQFQSVVQHTRHPPSSLVSDEIKKRLILLSFFFHAHISDSPLLSSYCPDTSEVQVRLFHFYYAPASFFLITNLQRQKVDLYI